MCILVSGHKQVIFKRQEIEILVKDLQMVGKNEHHADEQASTKGIEWCGLYCCTLAIKRCTYTGGRERARERSFTFDI